MVSVRECTASWAGADRITIQALPQPTSADESSAHHDHRPDGRDEETLLKIALNNLRQFEAVVLLEHFPLGLVLMSYMYVVMATRHHRNQVI